MKKSQKILLGLATTTAAMTPAALVLTSCETLGTMWKYQSSLIELTPGYTCTRDFYYKDLTIILDDCNFIPEEGKEDKVWFDIKKTIDKNKKCCSFKFSIKEEWTKTYGDINGKFVFHVNRGQGGKKERDITFDEFTVHYYTKD